MGILMVLLILALVGAAVSLFNSYTAGTIVFVLILVGIGVWLLIASRHKVGRDKL